MTIRWTRCLLPALLSLIGAAAPGCGGAAYSPEWSGEDSAGESAGGAEAVTMESEDVGALLQDLTDRAAELDQVLSHPTADCPTACELQDAICGLADRICAIAERNPSDGETQMRCDDAGASCEDARDRIASHCNACG